MRDGEVGLGQVRCGMARLGVVWIIKVSSGRNTMRVLLQLTGTTPLIMHNIRLADKQDAIAKEIAELNKKKTKTEDDYEKIEQLEFMGCLYHDPDLGVYLPTWNVVRALENAAKITREGSTLIRAVSVVTDRAAITHDGPKKPADLWAKPEYRWRTTVGIQGKKITRMRPRFARWGMNLEAELLKDVLDPQDLQRIAELAGRTSGLGDARKLGYGRFDVQMVS